MRALRIGYVFFNLW